MQEVYQAIVNASVSDANVVIYGESGTGKELVARTIHAMSDRSKQAFVVVNCGAVAESLFEREFFGHYKGAFTGADRDKPGYFDRTHGGTLFLDEIGELKPAMQVKLLRALESGEYIPVGGNIAKKVNVRIIAATNQNLKEQVRQNLIREDFFYRIHVLTITVPPLRNRKEDIPLLIDHVLKQYGDTRDCTTIPSSVLKALCTYSWPGNVRELQNELQRYLAEQRLEFLGDLKAEPEENTTRSPLAFEQEGHSFREAVEAYEKYLLAKVLEQHQGNTADAADALALPLRTLYRKIHKYQLL
jgi:transcriptional regulator with PAS, ATPase and Fis domain